MPNPSPDGEYKKAPGQIRGRGGRKCRGFLSYYEHVP